MMRSLSCGERAILNQDGPEDDSPSWRVLSQRHLKARKAHECSACEGACFAQFIRPGERYILLAVIDDGEFRVLRLCPGASWSPGPDPDKEKPSGRSGPEGF